MAVPIHGVSRSTGLPSSQQPTCLPVLSSSRFRSTTRRAQRPCRTSAPTWVTAPMTITPVRPTGLRSTRSPWWTPATGSPPASAGSMSILTLRSFGTAAATSWWVSPSAVRTPTIPPTTRTVVISTPLKAATRISAVSAPPSPPATLPARRRPTPSAPTVLTSRSPTSSPVVQASPPRWPTSNPTPPTSAG